MNEATLRSMHCLCSILNFTASIAGSKKRSKKSSDGEADGEATLCPRHRLRSTLCFYLPIAGRKKRRRKSRSAARRMMM